MRRIGYNCFFHISSGLISHYKRCRHISKMIFFFHNEKPHTLKSLKIELDMKDYHIYKISSTNINEKNVKLGMKAWKDIL